jgi:3-hydroxyacyl-CoA dehydrogenase
MAHGTGAVSNVVGFGRFDDVGIVTIDSPPVNAISRPVIAGLAEALDRFFATDLKGLVIRCEGNTFVAGGDISLFEDPDFSAAPFNAVLDRIELSDRPVVAAIHGNALGGGLELALACHARVAATGSRLGLPEISLGLMPGSLGTQRLPRLIGLQRAAEMIGSGKPIGAEEARQAGLVDAISDDLVAAGIEIVRALSGTTLRRCRDLPVADAAQAEEILAPLAKAAAARPYLPANAGILEALRASATLDYAEGEKVEARIFAGLVKSEASRALRHVFFAERAAQRVADLPKDTAPRNVQTIGILGAGTMGGGIGMAFANAGFDVTLVDVNPDALERGLDRISGDYARQVERGRLSPAAGKERRERIRGGSDIAALSGVDMVVEAVFEDMALKLDVMAQLGRTCKPGTILATNTSTLDVDRIAAASGRPSDVIGTHFFSPAQIMRLLELVRGAETAADTLATVMGIARKIGKTAVVTGVCYGFIGNRMAEVYMRESEAMQMEGASPAQIDSVAEDPALIGMAMGPSRMLDMAGVDVGARTVIEWIASGEGPRDPAYRALCQTLFAEGRHGQKTGQGFYRYEGREALPSEETAALAARLAEKYGVSPRAHEFQEILERLLYPMVNEAALILDEGIAQRASDIDVVWTAGYGFPSWRGGPLFMADTIGLQKIVAAMKRYGDLLGNDDGRWTPAPLLQKLASEGRQFSDL